MANYIYEINYIYFWMVYIPVELKYGDSKFVGILLKIVFGEAILAIYLLSLYI